MLMFCFVKQKTAYEMRISDWSSDVCSSDLEEPEMANYPKDPKFHEAFGPRGVLHTWATDKDDKTVMPRWGKVGKQKIQDTGPLTKKQIGRASCRERVCQYV